jgi:hypothetical protein
MSAALASVGEVEQPFPLTERFEQALAYATEAHTGHPLKGTTVP